MAASAAGPLYTASTTPPHTSYSPASSSPAPISFRRWLQHYRFHLMSTLLLSSTAVTVYRMYEQRRLQDEVEQQCAELDVQLSTVQRLTERRRQLLQQQVHGVWASPPTATATVASSASSSAPTAAPSGGWLSWSSWRRWWGDKTGTAATTSSSASLATHSTTASLLPLPLCGSSVQLQQLASLSGTRPPSAAYMVSVVSDCDYLLHTGTLPPNSPFNSTSATSASSSASATAAAPTAGVEWTGQSMQSVTDGVTGGGKRLLV